VPAEVAAAEDEAEAAIEEERKKKGDKRGQVLTVTHISHRRKKFDVLYFFFI
jgi:hypothetical protein